MYAKGKRLERIERNGFSQKIWVPLRLEYLVLCDFGEFYNSYLFLINLLYPMKISGSHL